MFHTRLLIYIFFLTLYFSINSAWGQDLFNFDSLRTSIIDPVIAADIGVADINNDGIHDLILSGYDDLNRSGLFLEIYNGNSEGTLDTFQLEIVDHLFDFNQGFARYIGGNGGLSMGDYDRDGLIDILVHGSENLFLSKNLGSSISNNNYMPSLLIENLINSDVQWGDIDLDGDLDLFWMGVKIEANDPYITNKLLLSANGTFESNETMVMPDLHNGSTAWEDIDLDGDLDLIISGESVDPLSGSTRLYKNDPLGRLAEDTNQEIIALKGTAICFADLDQDSDPDLVLSGWDPIENNLKTAIYINEPTGTFMPADQQLGFGTIYGTINAVDINLDGWIDLAISGVTEYAMVPDSTFLILDADTTAQGDTLSADTLWLVTFYDTVFSLGGKVFINDGDGSLSFTERQAFPGARTIAFADLDHDTRPDLITSGTDSIANRDSTFFSIYINITETTNTRPDPPLVLESFAVSNRAIFNWGSGSDEIDPDVSLRYNIRIGSSPGSYDLLSSTVPFNSSNVGTRLIREFTNIPWGTYYWEVQTIDASGSESNWSDEKELFIPRLVSSTQSLPGYSYGTSKWSDINEDGLLDVALTGNLFSGISLTQLFVSDNGLLVPLDQVTNIKNTYGGHLSFVDYTNDGHLDISLTGIHTNDYLETYPATFFYKWDDGEYVWDSQIGVTYYDYYDNVVGYTGGSNDHDWGDYDNDGDLDLVIGGGDFYSQLHLKIFSNNDGVLSLDTSQTGLLLGYPFQARWNDINNDGFIDLITITGLFTLAYINDGTGKMLASDNHFIELGITAGSFTIADFNSDGYSDFALAGQIPNDSTLVTQIYKNNDGEGFTLQQSIEGTYYGGLDWGDYDNDGDLDLIVTGRAYPDPGPDDNDEITPVTIVYKQENGSFAPDTTLFMLDSVSESSVQWGDYDNDGDLDLLLNGKLENNDLITKVYDNLEGVNNANVSPGRPTMLSSVVNQDTTFISWQSALDFDNSSGTGSTLPSGLRYQLQMGGDQNYNLYANTHSIISGNYGTGRTEIIAGTDRVINSIPEGRYQWRVQTVDHSLAHSEWSDWDYFYIDLTPPVIDTIQANYGVSGQIILVIRFEEEFEMDDLSADAEPHVLVTHPDIPDIDGNGIADTLDVIKQSYSAQVWTGLLTLPDDYVGRAIAIHISNAADKRGNVMLQETVFKTPEKIISQFGGTAISADGQVSVLLPQNAVNEDVAITVNPVSFQDSLSIHVTAKSGFYVVNPIDFTLNKPAVIRIGIPDESVNSETGQAPFIGYMEPENPLPHFLGGSIIKVDDKPFLQAQLSRFGTYATFTTDTSLALDSVNTDIIKCYPRIFSPAGSVFEFPSTNILFDLNEADDVTARVFNLSGRIKRTLNPEFPLGPGHNVLVWDGKDMNGKVVPSGLYIITLERSGSILKTTVGVLNR